ncbi:hypothetical protein BU24DRAFT_447570 [Aaosphaeria arxii CBS 175.79]|uniref:Zn(2)-C6 fungal-type domain-containing protein n=1 Tax=Aaosphaeria arxii CBS 175.79 TaxID=1450172 RepID=A0A6A5Y0J4_9PLEO|nr:uncharacterized protein BU24DRAFT_447570 [Aaosphaeria arxii CBS 175.79]KAF2018972.1 hypothetical protein BU24DRAFT_447570 [Aaosphaeria arxii CBS 175.79]
MDFGIDQVPQGETASVSTASPATPISPRRASVAESVGNPPSRKRRTSFAHISDPRQKRKVTRACDTCKSKKAKCSGTQPCDTCAKRGISCLYEARYLRGKPPTPPQSEPNRPLHSLDPMGSIEAANEQRLLNASIIPTFQPVNVHQQPSSSNQATPEDASSQTQPTVQEQRLHGNVAILNPVLSIEHGESHDTTLQPSKRVIHHDVPSRGSPDLEVAGQFSDSTSGHSFLHRAWVKLSNNQHSQLLSGSLSSGEENQGLIHAGDKPFQDSGHIQLPAERRTIELFDLYFDVCIATYRILHRPTVMEWYRVMVHNTERQLPIWHGLTRAQAAIVLTVLTIATFHDEIIRSGEIPTFPSVNDGVSPLRHSDALFCEALRLTEAETGFPKLESAQVRIVQVLYLLMSSRMNQAWYTFGHALQIISALGLHRCEGRKRPLQKRDYIEQQCRIRTFWSAYIVDKYMGVVFGRPRHYRDDDIDQHFPDAVNDEDMTADGPIEGTDDKDCHIDALIYHAKLAQILEKISSEVYSIKAVPDHERIAASHRLGRELRDWKASLPPLLGSINPSSLIASFRRQSTSMNLSYMQCVMLAHRPFLLKNLSNRQDTREMANESIRECLAAAQSVLEAVDRLARDGKLFHAFWWTHYVCFCALSVVYVWAIQQTDNTGENGQSYAKIFDLAERCLTHLAQATASNSPSRRYSIILQELRLEAKRRTARRGSEAALLHDSNSVNGNATALYQSMSVPAAGGWKPMFGSPIDSDISNLPNFLDDWQTTDWLELDSSAFVGLDTSSMM